MTTYEHSELLRGWTKSLAGVVLILSTLVFTGVYMYLTVFNIGVRNGVGVTASVGRQWHREPATRGLIRVATVGLVCMYVGLAAVLSAVFGLFSLVVAFVLLAAVVVLASLY
ncbi:hypothetical protein HK100_003592 [Physocladia obscura]|uniref:Uncharacterized protein n=1 Tax=Physocladia obscura TaxID=109957 RepID=A0AAD5T9B9_9FUNG|nr:hypothetical protein HK100_003592 [Physocladia obscura]